MSIVAKITLIGALSFALFASPAWSGTEDEYLCDFWKPSMAKMRWEKKDFPLKVYLPTPDPSLKPVSGMDYRDIVIQSLNEWRDVAPEIVRYKIVSTQSEADVQITWVNYFPDLHTWGMAMRPDKRRLNTIALALRAQPGTAFASTQEVPFSEDELLAIATHEIGHVLGLGHSRDDNDMMSRSLFRLSVMNKWSITPRDRQTLRRLYQTQPPKCP